MPYPHPPLTFRDQHIYLDNDNGPGCSITILGCPLWGKDWPDLKAKITKEFSDE